MDRAEEYRDVAEKEKTIYDDTHTHTHTHHKMKNTRIVKTKTMAINIYWIYSHNNCAYMHRCNFDTYVYNTQHIYTLYSESLTWHEFLVVIKSNKISIAATAAAKISIKHFVWTIHNQWNQSWICFGMRTVYNYYLFVMCLCLCMNLTKYGCCQQQLKLI